MSAISAIRRALDDGFARGDEASLSAFHQALLDGQLHVAEGGGETALPITLDGESVELGGLRDAEGLPLLAAFTGDDELGAWAGDGARRRAVAVPALARAALDSGIHAVSLNPAGPVGRQLDTVELRQLASGLLPRVGGRSFGFDPRSGVAVAAPFAAPAPAVVDALRAVCAHNGDIAAAYLVELMQPRRSADCDLAIALEIDPATGRERRQALLELVGAVVTVVPDAGLGGIRFVWLDGRLDGLVRARVRPAYVRDR